MLTNLRAIVGKYLAVGVRFFVLARAVRDGAELDDLRAALPVPLKVIRLTVPLREIGRRLRHDAATGSREDLREAAASIAASFGVGIEVLSVPNDRPVGEVAVGIMDLLGWPGRTVLPRTRTEDREASVE